MELSWTLGGERGERLLVTLTGPAATDEGYRWVPATVQLTVGGFEARTNMMLTFDDVHRFSEQLEVVHRNVHGVAEFSTIERQLALRVEVNPQGSVKVSGTLSDGASSPNTLTFRLDTDETFLTRTVSELSHLPRLLTA